MITADRFGDPKQFPVLVSLAEILEENNDEKCARYVSNFMKDMHIVYKSINHLDKSMRRYFHELIKNDFLGRASDNWKNGFVPDKVYTHLCNYIVGYCRMMNKIFT
jgi:hypothetical protein